MRMLRAAARALRNRSRAFSAASQGDCNASTQHKPGLKLSAALLFLPSIASFGLGSWQLMRREWKRDLLDRKRKGLAEEPVPLGDVLHDNDDPSALEYTTVVCEGVYDESKSVFIGPRLKKIGNASQRGYVMVTPLYPVASASGSFLQPPVLVNRGWVPHAWRQDFAKRLSSTDVPVSEPPKFVRGAWWKVWWKKPSSGEEHNADEPSADKGIVRVYGVVRKSEDPNIFVPLNTPSTGEWFYIDAPGMARYVGLPENTPYVEAVNRDSHDKEEVDFPLSKEPEEFLKTSLMPTEHLNYALTWYTLSAATAYMAVKRIKQKPPRRRLP